VLHYILETQVCFCSIILGLSYCHTENILQGILPSAPLVLSINTTRAKHPHHMCGASTHQ